jgi:phosphoglycerate dehydrogenase-like enzyme
VRSIHIGLLGLGNVGQGVLRILAAAGPALLTTDPKAILADPEIRPLNRLGLRRGIGIG